jgi:hypothetical protein
MREDEPCSFSSSRPAGSPPSNEEEKDYDEDYDQEEEEEQD